MTARMSGTRKKAFLAALGETGNVTVSCERTCVSRSWVVKARGEDAAFDAACRAALRQARDRLAALGANAPPSGWGHLDGMQLVVRGSNSRRIQIARARAGQISPAVEQRFLGALAATCNVKAALAAAGISKGAAYAHRKRWHRFARRWDEAVAEGYLRIESALVQNGQNLFSHDKLPVEMEITGMTFADAIHLIHMHKHGVLGIGKAPGARWRPPPPREVAMARVRRKLAAFAAGLAIDEADKARDRAEYARRRDACPGG